jgi:hypothetical protein
VTREPVEQVFNAETLNDRVNEPTERFTEFNPLLDWFGSAAKFDHVTIMATAKRPTCNMAPYLSAFQKGFAEAMAMAAKMWPKKP